MRLTTVVAVATILAPATLAAHPVASGLNAPAASDLSAAKRKKAKPAKNVEAAPVASPSQPTSGY